MRRKHVPIGLVEIVVEPYLTARDLPPGWIDVSRVGRPHTDRPERENAQAVGVALGEIARDTPLAFSFDEQTGTFIVGSTDEEALDAVIERLRTEHGQFVRLGAPQVAYRETITTSVTVDATHKRQQDGVREFARVKMRVDPAFDCPTPFDRSGAAGRLPSAWLDAVEQSVAEALQAGPVIGFPVFDLKVTLEDFAFHETDSTAHAFALAAAMAMREAVGKGLPVAVEPFAAISVSAPQEFHGAVIADIRSRRGRLRSADKVEGPIEAVVSVANLFGYRNAFRSITRGAGSFSILGFDSYQLVPPNIGPDDGPAVAAIA